MGKVIPSTLQVRLNGIRTSWMTNLSKWEAHSALHSRWLCISPKMYRRAHVPEHPGEPTDEELVKYLSVHLTSIHEWDLQSLTTVILKVMGSQSGLVIHNILIFLTLVLIPMGCIPRGLLIPCHPWLMCSKHLP